MFWDYFTRRQLETCRLRGTLERSYEDLAVLKQLIYKEACPVTNGLNNGYAKGDEIGHLHHLEEGFQHPDFFRGLRVGKSGLEIWVL